jgi:hypothetical protein
MPNWKKVIVSGSDAALNSLNVTSGLTVTGSFNVTGSTTQIGNNTLFGNTLLSGSITISGSVSPGSPTASVQIYGDIRQSGYHRFDPVSTNLDNSISASYIYVSGSTNDLYFSQNGSGYTNTTRLRWIEGNLYTGLLHGGLITTQSSTIYQIGSGSGIIVDLNASIGDDPYPTIQFLEWPNLSASIAPLTASYQQAFIGIDSTNNIYAQGTPFNNGQFNSIINVGNVLFQNQSTINGVKTQPSVAYGFEQSQNVFNRAFGPLKLSGYTLAPSGSSTGSLIVGSGTAYAPGANYTLDPNDPSYTIDTGTNISKIFRYYQSGSSWVYLTNAGAGYTTIDPSQYSNNGTLSSVGAGNWSIQRVFYFPNSVTKAIVVYYGNSIYPTEAEALANLAFESFTEAPNTAANAIYLGAIIINQNGVFTSPNTFTIYPGGLFRQVGGSGGGGSIITTTLAGLSDVSITSPTNGQPLVYNSSSLKWENQSTLTANLVGNASTATTASYALTASYTPSIAGTDNYIPRFNGSSALENSVMYDDGTNIGIGTTSPATKLQVNGTFASNALWTDASSIAYWGNYNTAYGGLTWDTGYGMIFSSGGNALRFGTNGTSARMSIDTSGNVGIGTTNPLAKLQVSSGRSYFFSGDNYSIGLAQTAAQSNYMYLGTATDGTFYISETGGTARVTVQQGGNVGIGTTNPATKLVVSNAGTSGFEVDPIGGIGSGVLLQAYNRSTSAYMAQSYYALSHTFNVGSGAGTRALDITSAGRVGIGTSSPGYLLDVKEGNTTFVASFTNTTTQTFISIGNSTDANYSGLALYSDSGTGQMFKNGTGSNSFGGNASLNIYNSNGSIAFHPNNISNVMFITGSNGGRVGIGTTSPVSRLQSNNVSTYNSSIPSGAIVASNLSSGDAIVDIGVDSTSLGYIQSRNINSTTVYNLLLNPIGGNVGIGTTSPSQKLHIAENNTTSYVASSVSLIQPDGGANLLIQNTGTGGFSSLRFVSLNGSNAIGYIGFDNSTASVGGDFVIGQRNGGSSYTEQVRITNAGNVGIGTTSPSASLNIASDGNTQFTITRTNASNSKQFNINVESDSQTSISYDSNSPLVIGTSTNPGTQAGFTERMRITSIGTVGIGTSSPTSVYRLTIDGAGTSGNPLGGITFRQGGTDTLYFGNVSTANTTDWEMWNPRNGYMRFATNNAERMRIASNGSIQFNAYGSGTFTGTATQKLAVDSSGNVIEIPIGAGPVDGSGTANYITRWSDTDTITTSSIYENSGNIGIGTTSPSARLSLGAASQGQRITWEDYSNIFSEYSSGDLWLSSNFYGVSGSSGYKTSITATYGAAGISVSGTGGGLNGVLKFFADNAASKTAGDAFTPTERMRITGGGNVGIGTTSPATALQVNGTARATRLNSTGGVVDFDAETGNNFIQIASSIVSIANGGNVNMTITSTGNVGIGTTNPGAKLQVNGDAYLLGTEYIFQTVNSSTGYLYFDHSGTQVWKQGIFNDNTSTFSIGNGGGFTRIFNITNAGNVGIGTTSPNRLTEIVSTSGAVLGIANSSGGSGILYGRIAMYSTAGSNSYIDYGGEIRSYSGPGVDYSDLRFYTAGGAASTEKMRITSGGALKLAAYGSGTNTGTLAYTLGVDTSGNVIETTAGTGTVDGTGTANYITRWVDSNTITTSSMYESSTNIGIGTTNPLDKLHVVGNAIVGNSGNISPDSSGNGQLEILGNGYQGYVALNATAMYFGHNSGVRNLTLQTDETDRLTITPTGNVGIGLIGPAYKLQVDGGSASTVASFINSSSTTTEVIIGDSGNTNYSQLILSVDSGDGSIFKAGTGYSSWGGALALNIYNSNGAIAFHPNNSANAMFIATNGNVGIGTTNPGYKLDVVSEGRFGTGAKVIIGTDGSYSGYGVVGFGGISNGSNRIFGYDGSIDGLYIAAATNKGIQFWTDGTATRMVIRYDGNVGIGTVTPSYLLDVNGTARVTTLIETSALKYKTNIQPLEPQLSKVTQLEPVTFDWLDKPQTKTNIGLIADEVEKIYPEFVSKTEDGEIEGIEYSKLTTVLIQSIKELKEIVDQQQAQINKLLNK